MWTPPRADRQLGPGAGLVLGVILGVVLFWLPLLTLIGWL